MSLQGRKVPADPHRRWISLHIPPAPGHRRGGRLWDVEGGKAGAGYVELTAEVLQHEVHIVTQAGGEVGKSENQNITVPLTVLRRLDYVRNASSKCSKR